MTSVYDLRGKFLYGMHGCGYYKGTKHANTYEGFKFWQSRGIKIMEVDISKTSDGEYVALAHKMTPEYLRRLEITKFDDNDAFTHSWFMNQKLFRYSTKGLHPMDLQLLVEEMASDEQLMVMFDLYGLWTSEETKQFTEKLNCIIGNNDLIQQRTVIEAYNKNMIDGIRSVADNAFPIIYCIRENSAVGNHEWLKPEQLKNQGISIISYPWHYSRLYEGEMGRYVAQEFLVFSYCADNEQIENCRLGGANIVLVDVLFTKSNRFYKYPIYLYGRLKNKIVQKLIRKFS